MAIYHMTTKPVSRSKGRSATAAAAYRAGEKILDERTGETHDYTRRRGVDKGGCCLVLPRGLNITRAELWNAAEAAEKRKDSRVAREWEVALPVELTEIDRRKLARDFAKEIVDKYGVAADVCIHQPSENGDQRNCHAHILTTTRRVDVSGTFGEKSMIEREDKQLRAAGLPEGRRQVEAMRQVWERLANLALKRAGHDVCIDHRSLELQGVERAPTVHLGPIVSRMEQRGVQTERGDLNRTQAHKDSKELATLEQQTVGVAQFRESARKWNEGIAAARRWAEQEHRRREQERQAELARLQEQQEQEQRRQREELARKREQERKKLQEERERERQKQPQRSRGLGMGR